MCGKPQTLIILQHWSIPTVHLLRVPSVSISFSSPFLFSSLLPDSSICHSHTQWPLFLPKVKPSASRLPSSKALAAMHVSGSHVNAYFLTGVAEKSLSGGGLMERPELECLISATTQLPSTQAVKHFPVQICLALSALLRTACKWHQVPTLYRALRREPHHHVPIAMSL